MTCQRCHSRPASVHIRRTVNGRGQEYAVCAACATEQDFFDDPLFDAARGRHYHQGMPSSASAGEQINILDAFSDRARGVIQHAAQAAVQARSPSLDTEHLLIGVAEEPEVGQIVLKNMDIDPIELSGYLRENMTKDVKDYGEGVAPDLSPRAKRALELSWQAARNLEHDYVGSEHILLGLLLENEGLAAQTLGKYGISETKVRQAILSVVGEKGKKTGKATSKSKTPTLDQYSRDLTKLASEGKLDPVIGRGAEVQRVVQIISRRTKNNPILIGEPGTGKTAIAEGLATRIVKGNVPETLKDKRVVSLDLPAMLAGSKYRGEFEERLTKVIKEIEDSKATIILFIDELHTIMGAGSSGEGGAMDAANILKPALARGALQAIGATTLQEYKKYIEKDGALERRFQPVLVEESAVPDAIEILRGLKDRYEAHHKVVITDEAIVAAVTLSDKYVRDRYLPDKAIDLMDEAAAKVRLTLLEPPEQLSRVKEKLKDLQKELAAVQRAKNTEKIKQLKAESKTLENSISEQESAWKKRAGTSQAEVLSRDIEAIIAAWTGIPVEKISEAELDRLLHLEEELHRRVIAQDEAVASVAATIRRNRAGLKDPKRPLGSFLFLGPTGVGKTELTKALAELLFGSDDAMIRLDISEYMERHAVSRMIGSPPGYVGHDEGGQLTESVRRKPYSVILLDEIEKAHPDVFNILLQVLEDGRLTDGRGRVVDFKQSLIIMTSNVGSRAIQEVTASGLDPAKWDELKRVLLDNLKEVFRPEFLNRIDEVITFHALQKVHVQQIVDLMLDEVARRVAAQGLRLEISDEVRNRLASDGYDPQFGARPLRRQIQRRLENKLSTALLTGEFPHGSRIQARLAGDDIAFQLARDSANRPLTAVV